MAELRPTSVCLGLLSWGLLLVPALAVGQGGTSAGRAASGDSTGSAEIRPPTLIESTEAEYTDRAVEARIEGTVVLKLTIDEEGRVSEVKVVDGLGHGLDESAREAARSFEFEPARRNGEPIPVTLTFRIDFSLPPIPAELAGTVVGAKNGEPISGAVVRLEYRGDEYEKPPSARANTGDDGTFEFQEVPPGPYRLQLEAPGRSPESREIELNEDERVELTIELARPPVRLAGTVREAGSKERLAGIEVELRSDALDAPRSTYTKSGGAFQFRGLPPARYVVSIDANGYASVEDPLRVPPDDRVSVTYYLRPVANADYSVRTETERQTQSLERDTIRLEEIRRIPGSGSDPVRSVQNLPGVARPSFGSGQIVVRGASPSATKTFIRGDEVPFIYHFFGGPAIVNAEMIDAVDFYPGNFSARYGRALGGVVDLQTREPRGDRYHAYGEVDLIDATAQVEGPITDDLTFAAAARRSYIGDLLPALASAAPGENDLQTTVAPRYYDFQAWLNWDVSDAHRLELLAYGSDDRVQVVFDENEPQGNTEARLTGVNFGNSVYRGQLRWTWRPEGPVQNTMMASYGVNSTRLRVADNLFFDGSFYQLQVRDDFEWKIASNLTLNAGADIQAGTTRYSFEFPRLRDSTDQNPDGQGGGRPNLSPQGAVGTRSSPLIRPAGYVEVSYRPVENLELIPGLRFDYYGDVEQASVSPRGKVRYEISDEWTAKAGVGLFTQPPLPNETEPQFGNPGLTFEKAIHYSAGAVWEPLPFLELDATLYYRDLNDLVQQTLDRQRDPETGELENEIYDNSGRGRSYGLELLVRHKPANRFFGWVAYTLSRSERWDRRAGEYVPFQYDQTHNLTAVAGYELPKNWSVSGRFRLVTGNPYTPVVGGVYNADLGKYEKVFGRRNSRRTATFDQLDLRIDKKWVFDRWELGAYLDVINVYNAKNQEGVQYNFDFSERAPIRGLPLIPTLGLTGRY